MTPSSASIADLILSIAASGVSTAASDEETIRRRKGMGAFFEREERGLAERCRVPQNSRTSYGKGVRAGILVLRDFGGFGAQNRSRYRFSGVSICPRIGTRFCVNDPLPSGRIDGVLVYRVARVLHTDPRAACSSGVARCSGFPRRRTPASTFSPRPFSSSQTL